MKFDTYNDALSKARELAAMRGKDHWVIHSNRDGYPESWRVQNHSEPRFAWQRLVARVDPEGWVFERR